VNWHARYSQQANWTRNLREYLFQHAGMEKAQRVLEVGCGTGAILSQTQTLSLHGLDILPAPLLEARVHAPTASLTCGNALFLPYPDNIFDITFCHFLLLWIEEPQRTLDEMRRVTQAGGHVLALAEPDYTARVDEPTELSVLGRWQSESLQRQGADPSLGGKLAELFYQNGIELIETGVIESQGRDALTSAERELEWVVLENDLAGSIPADKIQHLKNLDAQAWARGERIFHIPTYFAWGQV